MATPLAPQARNGTARRVRSQHNRLATLSTHISQHSMLPAAVREDVTRNAEQAVSIAANNAARARTIWRASQYIAGTSAMLAMAGIVRNTHSFMGKSFPTSQ